VQGNVDLHATAWLLLGSIPGIWISSRFTVHLPQDALRLGLAGVLALSGIKLLNVPEASYVIAIGLALGLGAFAVWLLLQSRSREAERTDDSRAAVADGDGDGVRGDAALEARAEPDLAGRTSIRSSRPSATARPVPRTSTSPSDVRIICASSCARPRAPRSSADRDFPKGMVHVKWDGRGVPDGIYHAVVHLQRAQRTIDLPNPIRVDTVKPTIALISMSRDSARTLFRYRALGARTRTALRQRRTPHPHVFDTQARKFVYAGRLIAKTRLVLRARGRGGQPVAAGQDLSL
jgi:hypothetical protein